MAVGSSLSIVGGTYLESCADPAYHELYGSGFRAACALSGKGFEISFHSCLGENDLDNALAFSKVFNIQSAFAPIGETVTFCYHHPLSKPLASSSVLDKPVLTLPNLSAENVLYYGMIEAQAKVAANYVVYDPQNHISFKETHSSAEHLAFVLNKSEAVLLANMEADSNLAEVGKRLLVQEGAEIIVIKDGPNGGLIVTDLEVCAFPVYATEKVWPIGSGDIFSAAFAWKWMIEKLHPATAANLASQFTAEYCESQILPLPQTPINRLAIPLKTAKKKVYLAGPFFTAAERWQINEYRKALISLGNDVFSPYHDVGLIHSTAEIEAQKEIVKKDFDALDSADVVLAILNGLDVGSLIEFGYAIAKGKKVVAVVENINPNDMTMIVGSGCVVVNDISTAVYKASW